MIRTISQWAVLALLTLCLMLALPLGASAKDFYDGKNMELLIGYSPGGGYDTYGRLLARHLGKHIPGNPKIITKNMPGAGSLKLTNYLYNIAPKDGSVIGIIGRGLPMEPLLGGEGVNFKPNKFTWIGSLNNEVSICASWHESKIKNWNDLLSNELVVGGTGSGADTDTFPIVLRNILGAKIKLISGYPGGSNILLAMERGEVAGRCGWSWSSVISRKADWIKDKKVNILLQMSLSKHPDIPEVPLVMDIATTQEQKSVLKLIFARQVMGRPFLAPPGIPADRAAILRKAFDAMVKDSAFLAEANKAKLEINPVNGQEISDLVAEMFAYPKNIIEKARAAVAK